MTPIHDLAAHYQHLLTCPELIDTRDHLPLFHSLPGHVLEIGCDVGNSTTAFLAGSATSVTSVDINPRCGINFPGCAGRWRFINENSHCKDAVLKVANQQYSVLYIDGDHTYEGAMNDLRTYSALVLNHGLILVHDVLATDNFPGVFRAFSRFHSDRMRAKYVLPGSYGLGVIEL